MLNRTVINKTNHVNKIEVPPSEFRFEKKKIGESVVRLLEPKDLVFITTYGVAPYDKEIVYTDWWYDSIRREARRTKNIYYTLPVEIVQVVAPSDSKQLGNKNYLMAELLEKPFNRFDKSKALSECEYQSQVCLSEKDFNERFNKERDA